MPPLAQIAVSERPADEAAGAAVLALFFRARRRGGSERGGRGRGRGGHGGGGGHEVHGGTQGSLGELRAVEQQL